MDAVTVNNILNLVQTVILAWIASHPGRYYGSRGPGRMQHDATDSDD